MASAETPEEKLSTLMKWFGSEEFDDEVLSETEVRIVENTDKYTKTRSMTPKEVAIVERVYEKFWQYENRSSY